MNQQPEPDEPFPTDFNLSDNGDAERINIVADLADSAIPDFALIRYWVNEALTGNDSLSIRIIDTDEMIELNRHFANNVYATNVLSFPVSADPENVPELPAELPEELERALCTLGDIAICAPTVAREAAEQRKESQAHWAHMVVHGTLHLRGFDHQQDHDAEIMEAEEARILTKLGFSDPYANSVVESSVHDAKRQPKPEDGAKRDDTDKGGAKGDVAEGDGALD